MKRIERVEVTLLNGNKEEFDVFVGAMELISFEVEYEKITGKESTFIKELQKIQDGSMKSILILLAISMHKKDSIKSIGLKYLNENINVFENLEVLMEALGNAMESNKLLNKEGK